MATPLYYGCNEHGDKSGKKDELYSGGFYAVQTLHVKHAFNSTNWCRIKGALIKIGVPGYLASLTGNYFLEIWRMGRISSLEEALS